MELWVYAEQRRGKLVSSSLELLGLARKIADEAGWRLSSILLGYRVEELCKELIAHGADRVYLGMLSKGFKFKVSLKKLTKREIIQIVVLIFISLSIVFVDRVMLC